MDMREGQGLTVVNNKDEVQELARSYIIVALSQDKQGKYWVIFEDTKENIRRYVM
jgi:hypothetical protein